MGAGHVAMMDGSVTVRCAQGPEHQRRVVSELKTFAWAASVVVMVVVVVRSVNLGYTNFAAPNTSRGASLF